MSNSIHNIVKLCALVDDLSTRYPPGTECEFYHELPPLRGPVRTRIRSAFAVQSGTEVVVWVEGIPGCVAATHVRVNGVPVLGEQG